MTALAPLTPGPESASLSAQVAAAVRWPDAVVVSSAADVARLLRAGRTVVVEEPSDDVAAELRRRYPGEVRSGRLVVLGRGGEP